MIELGQLFVTNVASFRGFLSVHAQFGLDRNTTWRVHVGYDKVQIVICRTVTSLCTGRDRSIRQIGWGFLDFLLSPPQFGLDRNKTWFVMCQKVHNNWGFG